MHVGAVRLWPTTRDVEIDAMERTFSVQGAMLHGTLALMNDDANLTAQVAGRDLLLQASGRTARVRTVDRGGEFVLPPLVADSTVVIDRGDIGPKLAMLSGVAARTLDKPALTGINVSTGTAGLLMRATDGHGRACMVTQSVREQRGGEMSFTAPAADLSIALQECGREVTLEQGGSILHMNDGETFLRLSLIHGEYPSFRSLPRRFDTELVIPTQSIDVAVRAAALMSQHGLVALVVEGGRLSFVVSDAERGDFKVDVMETTVPEFMMLFDAEYLGQVARASGIETVMQRAGTANQILVRGNGWYYWLAGIIQG
jgi:hypothetical protein